GMLDVQYAWIGARINRAQNPVKAVVDRAEYISPERDLPGHFQPVRAVAISRDPKKPLIVSASEDKTVRVWDRVAGQVATWRHDVPVRAVACTPKTAEANLCLTGADDGIARLF